MRDPATGQSRGFGFLTMVDPENVTKVLNQADHHLDGKKIDPKRAVSRSEQAQQQQQQQQQQSSSSLPERSEKIFVGGISSDVDQDEFRAFFERFGAVAEATLMVDRESGRPRGFGFITFEEASAVERALEATDLVIKDKQVEIKRAMPKTKRMPGSVRPPPNSRYAGAAMGGMMYPAGNAAAQTNPYAAMAAAYYGRMNGGAGNSYQQQEQDNHHHHHQQHRRRSGGDDDDDDDRRRHYSRDRDHHHHSSSSSSSRRHRDSSRDDRYHRSSSRQPYDDRTGGGAVHASSSTRNQSSYRPY
jgi:RNA recognition motif-containing protein